MERALYHKDIHTFVGDLALGSISLDWTQHALERAWSRGIRIVTLLEAPKGTVFEVELSRQAVEKVCVRVPYSAVEDVCFVLRPVDKEGGRWLVVTCWLNKKGDRHTSLDRTRYAAVA